MKTCPYCSEEFQDAAAACPACGRAFPEGFDQARPRKWGRLLVVFAAALVAAFVAYRLLSLRPDARRRDEAGRCLLRARVYADATRRMLGLQNMDTADWTEVGVTISGDHIAGSVAGQATGPFAYRLPLSDSGVAVHKVREITLDQFESAAGPRWIPMTMRATAAVVTAKIAGESCTVETALPQP